MNVFFGPLCDVAGYAFATAAVIAPFSGFNIVTGCVVKTNRGRVANTVNYLATKVLSDHVNCWVCLVINKHVGFFITEHVCSTYDLGGNYSRMRSKGSRFTLGVWGLRVCSLDVAFVVATVRNRSQPFARSPYGRAYGKFCRGGHFWRFQMCRCFVSRGRRGTS